MRHRAAGWLGVGFLLLSGCADDRAPRILWVSFPPATADVVGPYQVEAVVVDDCCLERVELLVSTGPGALADRLEMEPTGEDHHLAGFGGLPAGTVVYLQVEASDAHGNRAWFPESAEIDPDVCQSVFDDACWYEFRVLQP